MAASTSGSEKSVPGLLFSRPAKKKIASLCFFATKMRGDPLLLCPGKATRFLHSPPPRSASNKPCSISRAAWHNPESLTTLRAQRLKVLVLKTLFIFGILSNYSTKCNRGSRAGAVRLGPCRRRSRMRMRTPTVLCGSISRMGALRWARWIAPVSPVSPCRISEKWPEFPVKSASSPCPSYTISYLIYSILARVTKEIRLEWSALTRLAGAAISSASFRRYSRNSD